MSDGHDEYPGVPRWVIVALTILLALLVAAVVAAALVGGDHGPGRHLGP